MKLALGLLAILTCSVECPAGASPCPRLSYYAELAGKATGTPTGLLEALWFAESTCNPNATNRRTGARGQGQILPGGSAARGFPDEALWDVSLNAILSAEHLKRWRRRCGSWRGAVTVYHGNGRCSARSRWADLVIENWRNGR